MSFEKVQVLSRHEMVKTSNKRKFQSSYYEFSIGYHHSQIPRQFKVSGQKHFVTHFNGNPLCIEDHSHNIFIILTL